MIKKNIPIFFSCDENYIPYLTVTIRSIIENETINYIYDIYVLNTSLSEKSKKILKDMENENTKITFVNLEQKIKDISSILDDVRDYYTQAIFYRVFIGSLFPNLNKAIYLDCDIVLLDDIAKLYETPLNNKIFGCVIDDVVTHNEDFIKYVKETSGTDETTYFNSGVLLINLDEYRKNKIEEKFVYIIKEYNFPSIAHDQDYLNYLTFNKVLYLDSSWNKMPIEYHGEQLHLIHYNMFLKPWHYDIILEEYFWKYAKLTPFYDLLKEQKANYPDDAKKADLEGVERMVKRAYEIMDSKYTLINVLKREELWKM